MMITSYLLGFDGFQPVSSQTSGSAHLRLQVVGSNLLWGFHEDTILTLIRLLNAAVEEEGNMSIFLGFSDSCLFQAMSSQEFAEGIGDCSLYGNATIFVRNSLVIIGEADIGSLNSLLSCKAVKIIISRMRG